jgi:di/tricarboxylate transporter
MDRSFLFAMVAVMAVVVFATIWLTKRFIQPPTAAGKKRLTVFLRFIVAQYVIVTTLALLTVEHVLQPWMLGILGLANLIGSFLILWAALKRAPISDRDITREQRIRGVKSSKLLIAIYVFALINGLFHIRELPVIGIIVGIAVNVLILIALITNLRRNQAKLSQGSMTTSPDHTQNPPMA